MENLNISDEAIIKKWLEVIKPIWIVSFFLAICLIFIGYQFGYKKLESSIYTKGVEAGKIEGRNELFNWEIQQIQMYGGFSLTFSTPQGTTTVNLIRQINATTTQ